MKKEIIKAWGLSFKSGQILYPLFHTKKEAKKYRFVEDLVRVEIKVIRREPIVK